MINNSLTSLICLCINSLSLVGSLLFRLSIAICRWLGGRLRYHRLSLHVADLIRDLWLCDFGEEYRQLFYETRVSRKYLGHLLLELLLGGGMLLIEVEDTVDVLLVLIDIQSLPHFLIKSLHDICFNFRLDVNN